MSYAHTTACVQEEGRQGRCEGVVYGSAVTERRCPPRQSLNNRARAPERANHPTTSAEALSPYPASPVMLLPKVSFSVTLSMKMGMREIVPKLPWTSFRGPFIMISRRLRVSMAPLRSAGCTTHRNTQHNTHMHIYARDTHIIHRRNRGKHTVAVWALRLLQHLSRCLPPAAGGRVQQAYNCAHDTYTLPVAAHSA